MARAQAETLRPRSDLGAHGKEVVRQARKTGRPVMLTQRGRGVAVVLSLRSFEDLRAAAAQSSKTTPRLRIVRIHGQST